MHVNVTANRRFIVQWLMVALVFQSLQLTKCNTLLRSIQNGCLAYGCKRVCAATSSMEMSSTPGDNGYKIEVDGLTTDGKYIPGQIYKG